jgi:molybdate/tungstate transport system permease protein
MAWLKINSPFLIASTVLGILMVLFIIVPVVASLASAQGLSTALTDPLTLNAIFNSFYCAFLATLLMLVLGVPFAYMFNRYNFFGKRVLDAIIDVPILIPHNTAGIALLLVLTPGSPIGALFAAFGIGFIDTVWGIIIAMAFVSAPFMIRSAQEAFASIDPKMEKMAKGLGANQSQVFRHVTFPLASRGVLTEIGRAHV